MAKTKYLVKKGSKRANFLCILVRNLNWIAPGLGWRENWVFFVTPEVHAQPWLHQHKDSQNLNFFRTPYCRPSISAFCLLISSSSWCMTEKSPPRPSWLFPSQPSVPVGQFSASSIDNWDYSYNHCETPTHPQQVCLSLF